MPINPKLKGFATIRLILIGFLLIAGSGLWYYALRWNNSFPDPHLPFYGIDLKINNISARLQLKEGDIVKINWEAVSSREYNIRNCKGSGAPQNSKFNQNLANSGNIKETFSMAGEYEVVINCALEKNNSSIPAAVISNSVKVMVGNGTTSDESANWKTYRNEKYGFELKYPNALITQEKSGEIVLLDASLEIIHITAGGDPRLLGASFCQARPDNAACETVESLSGKILIYWSDNNRLGEARIDSGQYAILFTQLKQSEEYKKWFKEILFTFKFTN